jgi:hypothetical protein
MRLGLSTSRDPRDPAVASGSAILLATVKTLFNGRSKFEVAPDGRKIKLGSVLIDDAHAYLATIEEQFEIRLPASHPAYEQLLTLFEPALRQQQPASLLELIDEDPYAVMLVPPGTGRTGKIASCRSCILTATMTISAGDGR